MMRAGRPDVVVGFGGYPAWPTLSAASGLRIPTVIHEQNAVLGRVNRLAARRARAIATAYSHVARIAPSAAARTVLVGNPVRADIVAIGAQPFAAPGADDPVHLLVTGGSQGATILSDVVPAGLALLDEAMRARLRVVQQCRPEDLDRVRAAYAAAGIHAEVATYLDDMAARLAATHLFIGRAGASTIAELTVAGRPAILVPLASAMDDHQSANAREMARAGAATMIAQADFTPRALADALAALAGQPGALAAAAAASAGLGFPRAAQALADLVIAVGEGGGPRAVGRVDRVSAPQGGMMAGAAA
jgi:UDP-N-acetylglucosamine--N-acetylmuramyl-(pentapeptide) pyrophosphoryl-undecaprenol N-acetylglucosamine transferase